jgi:hypothetical protein
MHIGIPLPSQSRVKFFKFAVLIKLDCLVYPHQLSWHIYNPTTTGWFVICQFHKNECFINVAILASY